MVAPRQSTQVLETIAPPSPSLGLLDPLLSTSQTTGLNTSRLSAASTSSPGVRETITDFIGDDRRTAFNVGDVNFFNFNYPESLGPSDRSDWYRFEIDTAATVELSLSELSADADLYLVDRSGQVLSVSRLAGTAADSIQSFLEAGVYYAEVRSWDGVDTSYRFILNGGGILPDPGDTLSTAYEMGTLSRTYRWINESISENDSGDYYRFELTENGDFSLSLTGLTSDLNVMLYDRTGTFITASTASETTSESINQLLTTGIYYARVTPACGCSTSSYRLEVSTNNPTYYGTRTLSGSLGADTFDVIDTFTRTVISGNGNVDFGQGQWDLLDLSNVRSTDVTLNLADLLSGGILYDPGNGTRVFDAITFSDGREVLFEGIDRIQFADRAIDLFIQPNDPYFSQQWNLHMISVHNAWRLTTGDTDVLIGIEDSGLGYFNGNIADDLNSDTTDIISNNYVEDYDDGLTNVSHGTGVQGIIAAESNNAFGMAGINWNSNVFHIDVLEGELTDQSIAEAAQTIIDAAAPGQRVVINMSLGWNTVAQDIRFNFPAIEAVIAANPNVLFVIAAGNRGNTGTLGIARPSSLAQSYRNVMAIGAVWGETDRNGLSQEPGTRIEYSPEVPYAWGSQYGSGLTLMAPSEVLTTNATLQSDGSIVFNFFDQFKFSGTSAATPHVTGVASLVWSANPYLSAAQVNDILSDTAIDLDTPGYDIYTGHGLVNADAAVRRAIAISRGAIA